MGAVSPQACGRLDLSETVNYSSLKRINCNEKLAVTRGPVRPQYNVRSDRPAKKPKPEKESYWKKLTANPTQECSQFGPEPLVSLA